MADTGKTVTTVIDAQDHLLFSCPHCKASVIVRLTDINCGIFRHGAGVGPHAPEAECDARRAAGDTSGCFGPFQVEQKPPYVVKPCDYI